MHIKPTKRWGITRNQQVRKKSNTDSSRLKVKRQLRFYGHALSLDWKPGRFTTRVT